MTKKLVRIEILDAAAAAIDGGRDTQYGRPEKLFPKIANLWSAYLGREVHAHDVALMMNLMKVARAQANPHSVDQWVDIAGYAACGYEAALETLHAGEGYNEL